MKLLKPWLRQPQDGFDAALGKQIELLVSGASAVPWSTRGLFLPTARGVSSPTKQGVGGTYTFSNADYQKLTRASPLTLITVGVVTGTLATGSYPSLISGTLSGSFTRGGIELGIGGDLGGGAGDVGRVYSVVRSDTYRAEQTLIKTTATVAAGQIIVAMQRITPTLHELFVDGVGSASTATIADPGANNSETLKFGATSGAATAYVMAHARITRYVPDAEWAYIKSNVWRALFEPRRIWVPVSAAAPTSYTLTAAAGSFALTGNAAGLRADRKLTAAAGSFSLTGNAAGLYRGLKLTAAAGSFAWTGNAASLVTARSLVAAAGAYVQTGNAAALRINRIMAAASGSYTFTGNDASLVHSAPGSYSITASAGAYSLTGNAAALRADRRLAADAGVFNLTGSVAQLLRGYRLAATAGSFAFTGNDATLSASQAYSLTAAAGSFSWTGNAAGLTYSGAVFTDSDFWKYTVPAQNLIYAVPAHNLVYQVPPAGLTFTI